MFLVGKGIPSHITSLPQTVLNTPFGQMLKPQLDNAMRGITQAPVPPSSIPNMNGSHASASNGATAHAKSASGDVPGIVYHPTRLAQLEELLALAKDTCAVIFFTSATCPPCKLVYPAYDELAASAGRKAFLIKVDLSDAYEIGARYQVRVTPTFMSFLKGEKENEWTGANESQLRGNVKLLIEMANPAHPHTNIRMPTIERAHRKPITYPKVPPLDKLVTKLGDTGKDPAVKALKDFNLTRAESGAVDAPLPSLPEISENVLCSTDVVPPETLFPLVDLLRLAIIDTRVSGYFATNIKPISAILSKVAQLDTACPYQLRIVTLHMTCNLFTSSLFPPKILADDTLAPLVLRLVTSSLLDATYTQIRVVAAQLAFNMAAANYVLRLDGKDDLISESNQVELMAALLEAMRKEDGSSDVVKALLMAIGLLKYYAPIGGELSDMCEAVGAKDLLQDVQNQHKDLKELAREAQSAM